MVFYFLIKTWDCIAGITPPTFLIVLFYLSICKGYSHPRKHPAKMRDVNLCNYSATGAAVSTGAGAGLRISRLNALNSDLSTQPSLLMSICAIFSTIFGHFTTRHPLSSNCGFGILARFGHGIIFAAAKPNAKNTNTTINFFQKPQ